LRGSGAVKKPLNQLLASGAGIRALSLDSQAFLRRLERDSACWGLLCPDGTIVVRIVVGSAAALITKQLDPIRQGNPLYMSQLSGEIWLELRQK